MFPRRWVAPVFLTLLAAALRVSGLADFWTSSDHAYPLAQAIGLLQSGRWPGLGQDTSILFANPPGMSYMVLVPWAIWRSAWGVGYFVIALNLLAVPLTYALMRGAGDEWQARAAALLVAVNPWTIFYSRGTWVQGLLPLWTTLTFVLFMRALGGRGAPRRAALIAAWAALTALTQMYLLAFLSVAQAGLIVLVNFRRVAWRALLSGAFLFMIVTGVYAYQLAVNWEMQSARVSRFWGTGEPLRFQSAALEHALRYVTGRDYEIVNGNDGTPAWKVRRGLSLTIGVALTLAVVAGIVRAIARIARRAPDASFWLSALLWWSAPIVAMSVTRQPVHIVYLLLTLPAGYVFAAPILAPLARGWRGLVLAGLLALNSGLLLRAGNQAVAQRPAGENLDQLSIQALLSFQPTAARLVDQYGLHEIYAPLVSESLSAKVGRNLQAASWSELPQFLIFPLNRPALYVRGQGGALAPPLPLSERVARLDYPGGDVISFDLIPAFTRDQLAALPQNRVDWPTAEGLTLIGYDLSPTGHQLTVYWLIEALAEERNGWLYAPYAHLINAQGRQAANVSAPGLPGYYYRLGDVYLYRIDLPDLPAGDYQLELGLFDGLHQLGITFLPSGDTPRPFYRASLTLP